MFSSLTNSSLSEKRGGFRLGQSDLWDLAGLPGVREDRQSAEGFVLETHVFSKLISQNGRKCPHGQCLSLLQPRVTKESPSSTLL